MPSAHQRFTGTKRVRKFFRSRGDALDYVARVYAIGYAKDDWRQPEVNGGKLAVAQAVSQFLLSRYEPEAVTNNRTLVQERQILRNFSARYGNHPVDALTHREIESWLRGINKAPVTRLNHFRIAKRFFKWMHEKEEFILRNPMLKVDEPRVERQEPEVLTPEQMAVCLEAAKDVHLKAYLTLGGFAGVRTEEILRMRWEDINWTDGHISILKPKRVTRWRPRHVDILPPLRRNLGPFALESGPIFPDGEKQLWRLRNQLLPHLGLERWPSNALRHSFASYFIPIHNDYPKLSIQMGHANVGMTRYKYGVLRPRSIAERWWSI